MIANNVLQTSASLQAPTNFDLESDANWVRADRADGPAMQEMVKDVITNIILPRGFDPNHDVQVRPTSRSTGLILFLADFVFG